MKAGQERMRSEAKGLGSAEFQPQSQTARSLEHKWHYRVGLLEAETRNSGFCYQYRPLVIQFSHWPFISWR